MKHSSLAACILFCVLFCRPALLHSQPTADSQLILYDRAVIDVSDAVSQFFVHKDKMDSTRYEIPRNIIFRTVLQVENISLDTVWCTKELTVWNDTGVRDELRQYSRGKEYQVAILPKSSYNIPIKLNLYSKYRFIKDGFFYVNSKTKFEEHAIVIKSEYHPSAALRINR